MEGMRSSVNEISLRTVLEALAFSSNDEEY